MASHLKACGRAFRTEELITRLFFMDNNAEKAPPSMLKPLIPAIKRIVCRVVEISDINSQVHFQTYNKLIGEAALASATNEAGAAL